MPESEIKIIQEIVVYQNKYGRLYDDDVLFLPQGKPGKYIRWVWNIEYSVGIVPIMENGDVVLVESFRHAARKPVLEIPKGGGDKGIEPLEMAKKELAQEAGLVSDHWEYLREVLTDTSFTFLPMHLYIAWDCRFDGSLIKPEDSEVIIARHKYPLSSVPELITNPDVYDVVTLHALMLTYQRRR